MKKTYKEKRRGHPLSTTTACRTQLLLYIYRHKHTLNFFQWPSKYIKNVKTNILHQKQNRWPVQESKNSFPKVWLIF